MAGGQLALAGTASQGALCDVLWSDPIGPNTEDDGWEPDKRDQVTYVANWDRGAGQFYGLAAVREFITHNKLDGIIRAHEVRGPVRVVRRRVHVAPAHSPLRAVLVVAAPRWRKACGTTTAMPRPSTLWFVASLVGRIGAKWGRSLTS